MITIEQLAINPSCVQTQLSNFIKNKLNTTHQERVIVSISGGVDSAVALAVSAITLGSEKVIAITLPERDITPKTDINDVTRLCEIFGVTCEQIEITPILQTICENIPAFNPNHRVAFGNVKARLRMLLAYYYANTNNAIVIGTSNKTELYLGYYTKYGDGGVDVMPFADLYKCQVRSLGRHLGIPSNITEKPASARLWLGQDTVKDLGLPYDNLDLIVYGYLQGLNPTKISIETGVDAEKVEKIVARIIANEHKRSLPAILRLS